MLKTLKRFFTKEGKTERSYEAAKGGRLTLDWITQPLTSDAALNGKISIIRERARDLERNNEWARGYLRVAENNIIGDQGITLNMRVRDDNGVQDEQANSIIEQGWKLWGKHGKCTLCGRYSFKQLCKLIVRTRARDGEILIRKVITKDGLKLQIIEADLLDENYNAILDNGNQVRMGKEIDSMRRVVAYYLLTVHPGDSGFGSMPASAKHQRIPAEEIIHIYRQERPGQSRGVSDFAPVMRRLKMLDGYAEAELVAARTGAAKMGFFEKKTPDGWTGVEDEDGNLSMDASPGTIEELPVGVSFKAWDVDHPNSGYSEFTKSMLRGVASSLGISYNTFSSDLEGVNYSSIRAGLIEEREVWKGEQSFLIDLFVEPVFSEWLEIELMRGGLGNLPHSKLWKFNAPEFRARRWGWVDPKKDVEANILAIRAGLKSLRQATAESGTDAETILEESAAIMQLADTLGVKLPELTKDSPTQVDTNPNDNE